jgi:hypothetical protein
VRWRNETGQIALDCSSKIPDAPLRAEDHYSFNLKSSNIHLKQTSYISALRRVAGANENQRAGTVVDGGRSARLAKVSKSRCFSGALQSPWRYVTIAGYNYHYVAAGFRHGGFVVHVPWRFRYPDTLLHIGVTEVSRSGIVLMGRQASDLVSKLCVNVTAS